MKNSFISRFLVILMLLVSICGHAFGGEHGFYDYSLRGVTTSKTTDEVSFIETAQSFKLFPDYSLGSVKPSIRFTSNSFDGKFPRSEPWPKLTASADFMGISQNEIPVNYSLSDADNRRKLIENLPFLPYFHFENGNTSAGILFWTEGKVNVFWKMDFW